MRKQKRNDALMPGGVPKWIRCYDNGGKTADRYTVIFTHAQSFGLSGRTVGIGMSENPYSPQGVGQYFDYEGQIDRPSHGHLGRRIKFADLPPDCQRCVVSDYAELWDLDTATI